MPQADQIWMIRWIDALANGSAKLSQHRLSFVERHGGRDRRSEGPRGHLGKRADDKGHVLIAASLHLSSRSADQDRLRSSAPSCVRDRPAVH